ncbi:hypothetical protein GH714_005282 [Hevea brasiliensis]|uniref:non-specific serine/threonine protein kinase n=1 Tax=Hevea brasiliensis TaxID=3981 RepID=A0A6A6KH74_HEVBR|nr:hypothetical protein GH714_005282 [Hevea brasiliensis]
MFVGSCSLDFKKFPYQPTGECLGYQEKVQVLGSVGTTLCCRNVLNVLTKTLASHVVTNNSDFVFIPQDEWMNCSGPFNKQHSVSPSLCGFDNLYNGSSKCSSFSLSSIKEESYYKKAVAKCSDFSSSFDDVCFNCTAEILAATGGLMGKLTADNDEGAVFTGLRCIRWYGEGNICNLYGDWALTLVVLLTLYVTKSRRKSKCRKPYAQSKEMKAWSGLYRFSKAEIENAINYGNEKKSLGRGSAGQVYKGVLPSGQVVAIKHIHQSSTSDSFQREVEGLSRVRHPNLVCLFGCCIEGGDRYLVYEYCSAGNLAQHLLRKDTVLTWETRIKILRGCALGLRYLHHYIDGCIVHRDIKARDVSLGKRPVTDFEDPRLDGKVNRADFDALLQIAVLCVAKSSKGRPTIDVLFEEMEKAWKNTVIDMSARRETSISMSMSRSMEGFQSKGSG